MKTKLLFLLPLLALIAACVSKPPVTPAAILPSGTFTGQFKKARYLKNGTIDSSQTANLMLSMETATGFKITGDTTTVHAGSYGSYEVSSTGGSSGQVEFLDKTYPTTGTPTKIHLDGLYDYIYDGTNLQMAAFSAEDTVEYFYRFTKTGN